jgi:hypothetical protein
MGDIGTPRRVVTIPDREPAQLPIPETTPSPERPAVPDQQPVPSR